MNSSFSSDIGIFWSFPGIWVGFNGHFRNPRQIPKFLDHSDFGFPRLGVAVPLRPGDVLIINPLEPHSVSSRCYESDEVFCFSAYLKSSNVGLHDNKLELTPVEKKLSDGIICYLKVDNYYCGLHDTVTSVILVKRSVSGMTCW